MIIPIIVTILGLTYIFSPIDALPELVLGPIGLTDDIFVGVIIFFTWMIYFSAPVIEMIMNVIFVAIIIAILLFIINLLWKQAGRTKKVKKIGIRRK